MHGYSLLGSWAERIRTLYYIALSNFVFPILFNIAELVVIFTDPNFFHGIMVVTVNCYVTIIGVMLATIWAQGSNRSDTTSKWHAGGPGPSGSRPRPRPIGPSSLQFTSRHVESQMPDLYGDEDGSDSEDELERHDVEAQRTRQSDSDSESRRQLGVTMPGPSDEALAVSESTMTGMTPTLQEKIVLFQSQNIGGCELTIVVTRGTIDEEVEPKAQERVFDLERSSSESSASGSTTAPELDPGHELRRIPTSDDERGAHSARGERGLPTVTSVPDRHSPCSFDVVSDPISQSFTAI